MSGRTIGRPSRSNGGDNYRHEDHLDHLVAFRDPVERKGFPTKYGPTDVAMCADVACVDCAKHYGETPIFGQVLAVALVEAGVDDVVGRIIRGTAAVGRSAPWLLEDVSDIDLARAEDFLNDSEEYF